MQWAGLLVLISAAALVWMLSLKPKAGIYLYIWYFIVLVIGAVLLVSIVQRLSR